MFKYREDRIPTALVTAYFGLDLTVFFTVENTGLVLSWMLLGILPKACFSSWNHHHQHVATFRNPLPNRLLEIVYAFHTGVVSNGWVLHHVLGHHLNYLDQEKDESRWRRRDGQRMGEVEYAVITTLTAYPRALQVGRRFPRQRRTLLTMSTATLGLLLLFFLHDWVNALFVFALPMGISLYITAWHTYSHHSGLESENGYEASYNITDKWHNVLTCNLGYHTAHHLRPALHWSRLPEFHRQIESRIPSHLYRRSPRPLRWVAALLARIFDPPPASGNPV